MEIILIDYLKITFRLQHIVIDAVQMLSKVYKYNS